MRLVAEAWGKAGAGLGESGRPLGIFVRQVWRRAMVPLCLSSLVAIGSFAVCSAPCWADNESDMARMETKFFQHSYPRDTQPDRLDRLEKMVFGEAKTGSDSDRLAKLLEAVPAGSASSDTATSGGTGSGGGSGSVPSSSSGSDSMADAPRSKGGSGRYSAPPAKTADNDDDDVPVKTDEKYPAVTAIEQKTLGKDYAGEPVDKRLARLETKLFGKPSSSSMDLSDRVDALKQRTGVDVARIAPKGSDWADEDDDMAVSPPSRRGAQPPISSSGYPREDARSFSGRDLQQDFQKAFGTGAGGGGSGSYGFGGGGANSSAYLGGSGSGSYGMGGGGGGTGYPTAPPSYRKGQSMDSPGGMGLNQQVSALEAEIFQKSWSHDPLPIRLNRLEATVFPNDKTLAEKSLPDRVANLVAHVPISNPSSGRKVARASQDDEVNDLLNGSGIPNMGGGMPTTSMSNPPQQKSGGLGKIINSIGSMLGGGGGGGYGYTGGYPMSGGALATDPSTGMLYDPTTGNLINPATGAVVGRRAPVYNNYGTGYGSNYGYGGGFNNGFSSPSPYGMNRGFGFGSGMGGMGMGGGMGGIRMGGIGGMWP